MAKINNQIAPFETRVPKISSSKVVKARRDYNTLVATESLEDYALRFAPKSFRKWSEFLVANTAMGGISFLALEAIGGSLAIAYGFANSFWAIVVVGAIIFLAGLPISYYAAKYNIDIDLLTRGAGFGYIGSTITSLIYASFTFIFFALEAAIMAQAIELYFHVPLALGYLFCSVIILPLVFFGVTLINKLQLWTQPVWIILMVMPYIFVAYKEPLALSNWLNFAGNSPSGAAFNPMLFGAAATVCFSLIAQLGEQVDYLRFLPDKQKHNRFRWFGAVIVAGPGWIIIGVAKQLGGAFLASLAINNGVSVIKATEPVWMYLSGFEYVFANPEVVMAVVVLFVIISQIKINVTNAYAGSLAWSNFFSRITHSHPGRVVWLVFNVAIALVLMELDVFATLQSVLAIYSHAAIAWIAALVADLVINKPLGISPSYIEFKRAHLYNINPVGFGSMVVASLVSIAAFLGAFGSGCQAYSSFIALGLAFVLSPTIAIITKGKYYIAREDVHFQNAAPYQTIECSICSTEYEPEDMAYCPVYDGPICSLCCSLEAHCHDSCKEPTTKLGELKLAKYSEILQSYLDSTTGTRIKNYLITFVLSSSLVSVIFAAVYFQDLTALNDLKELGSFSEYFRWNLFKLYAALIVLIGIGSWWFVLTEESESLVQKELDEQNLQLQQEVSDRLLAESALHQLTIELEKRVEERTAELKEALDNFKKAQVKLVQSEKMSSLGQLVAGVAHEINNPISFIYGNLKPLEEYSQNLVAALEIYRNYAPDNAPEIQDKIEELDLDFIVEDLPSVLASMEMGATRIRDIVLSLRNFSRLDESMVKSVDIREGIENSLLILKTRLKAQPKRIEIKVIKEYGEMPLIECHAGQLNQVFMNILSNAIDAIEERQVENKSWEGIIKIKTEVKDSNKLAIAISDNAGGIREEVKQKLFDPFFTTKPVGRGTGLGLSISYQIVVEKHRGKLLCNSTPGEGTEFQILLPLKR
ncbi:MAG: ATP-binding protein [Cyanobacteriota bacterium]|nr:ATP-binding protein [Cyanobacteriota bacterium]